MVSSSDSEIIELWLKRQASPHTRACYGATLSDSWPMSPSHYAASVWAICKVSHDLSVRPAFLPAPTNRNCFSQRRSWPS